MITKLRSKSDIIELLRNLKWHMSGQWLRHPQSNNKLQLCFSERSNGFFWHNNIKSSYGSEAKVPIRGATSYPYYDDVTGLLYYDNIMAINLNPDIAGLSKAL